MLGAAETHPSTPANSGARNKKSTKQQQARHGSGHDSPDHTVKDTPEPLSGEGSDPAVSAVTIEPVVGPGSESPTSSGTPQRVNVGVQVGSAADLGDQDSRQSAGPGRKAAQRKPDEEADEDQDDDEDDDQEGESDITPEVSNASSDRQTAVKVKKTRTAKTGAGNKKAAANGRKAAVARRGSALGSAAQDTGGAEDEESGAYNETAAGSGVARKSSNPNSKSGKGTSKAGGKSNAPRSSLVGSLPASSSQPDVSSEVSKLFLTRSASLSGQRTASLDPDDAASTPRRVRVSESCCCWCECTLVSTVQTRSETYVCTEATFALTQ